MSEWINADGSFGDMSSAPESVRSLVENKGWKNVEDIAGGYSGLEKMKGDFNNPNYMKLPETMTEDHWKQIDAKRNVPSSISEYNYDFGDKQIDDGLYKNFKEFAHESKLTQDQFGKAVDFWEGLQESAKETNTQQIKDLLVQGNKGLQDTWKDDYESNVSKANSFAEKVGLNEILDNYGIKDFPDVTEKLYELSGMLEESSLPGNNHTPKQNPTEELKQIMDSDAMRNRLHPEHKKANNRRLELLREIRNSG